MADPIRDHDTAFIHEALSESVGSVSEPVLLKIQIGENPGNPAHGIARTFVYLIKRSKAVISHVDAQDIMYSGGIYQVGDIQVQLSEELKPDDQGRPGDRMIWRGSEYRIVGRVWPYTMAGLTHVFVYVFRRIGKV
jgi:hypothetical protein